MKVDFIKAPSSYSGTSIDVGEVDHQFNLFRVGFYQTTRLDENWLRAIKISLNVNEKENMSVWIKPTDKSFRDYTATDCFNILCQKFPIEQILNKIFKFAYARGEQQGAENLQGKFKDLLGL